MNQDIWTKIATARGVEAADAETQAIEDAFIERFVNFTKENIPEWKHVVSGCSFEGIKCRAYSDKLGTNIVFDGAPVHTFYLPIEPFQSPELYWKESAVEFLDSCLEVINYED